MVRTSPPRSMQVTESADEVNAVKVPLGESSSLLGGKPTGKKDIDGIPENESLGYMLLLLSAFGYCLSGLFQRMATGYRGYPVACFLIIRGVMQSSFALAWIFTLTDVRTTFNFPRRLSHLLVLHSIGSGLALAIGYFGLSMIPFGICNSIFFLSTFND